jgi:hypothetical protein
MSLVYILIIMDVHIYLIINKYRGSFRNDKFYLASKLNLNIGLGYTSEYKRFIGFDKYNELFQDL